MFNYRNLLWAGMATVIAATTGLAQGTDNLVNTEWSRPIDNGTLSIRFQDAGKVLVIVGRTQGPGTYTKEGGNVTMTFSDGTFRGQIMGNTMNVTGVENTGRQFTFQVTRQGHSANPGANPAAPKNAGPAPAQQAPSTRLNVLDSTFHCKAGTVLAPQGWTTTGGVTVDVSGGAAQVNTNLTIKDPISQKQVEYFTLRPFTWNQNGGIGVPGLCFIPNQKGAIQGGFEVQPMVLDPQAFVQQYVLPRFRQGTQLKIVAVKMLPFGAKGMSEADKATFKAMGCRSSAGRVRVEYVLQGQAIEEDFYVELTECTLNSGGNNAVTFGTSNIYAVRSAKGQLDADTNSLVAVAESFQFDPAFKADLDQARQIGLQTQANTQNAVMERSKITRDSQNYCAKLQTEAYQNRQMAQDRSNQHFSNYIRGVEQYNDPQRPNPVVLPAGYNNVWGNGTEQNILSNSPNVPLPNSSWYPIHPVP